MFKEKKIVKLVILAVLFVLISGSATQAIVTKDNLSNKTKNDVLLKTLDETYTWEDTFDNQQKIDMDFSDNYVIENGKVKIESTEPMWTNPSFSCMKVITLNSEVSDSDCAVKIIVNYDSDMKPDYGDLRFKFQDDNFWLDYYIESKNPNPNDPYAIVWVKLATLPKGESKIYMFYGNPSAEDQSDYWSVFDENSWSKTHVHDKQVTYHHFKEGTWDPDVTWGDGKYLLTWEEGTAFWPLYGTIFQQQIRAQYFNADGEAISDRFDIVDEPDETPPYRYENPSSAYGKNGKFLVVYEQYLNPISNQNLDRNLELALVDQASDGVSKRLTLCSASNIQADPCVTFDSSNDRFFVVWEDARQGTNNYDIYGRFVDLNGNLVGSEKVLSNRPNTQCEPWVTFDDVNNHYMIVWEEGIDPENGPFDIWGQLFDANGNPLGSEKRLSLQGSSSTDYNFPCVGFSDITKSFLVTWNDGDISSDDWNGNVWGIMLDENGNIVVDIFEIARGSFCRTSIVPYLSTSFFVAYDSLAGGSGDIWGKLINQDGSVNPYTLQLSDSDTEPCDWANIASDGSTVFVAWEDERIVYQPPFNIMPDIYSNTWSLNIPNSQDISYSFGNEKTLILEAVVTSVPINPPNLDKWDEFNALKSGDVTFDILDSNNQNIILSDISPGKNLAGVSSDSIRLRATLSRDNPSTSPWLDQWSVTYFGLDEEPPQTEIQRIDGVKGLNEYYISESVTLWLKSQDYPADTGSGVKETYYEINNEDALIYNQDSGIHLTVSQGDNWQDSYNVNFWSVDFSGNVEDKSKEGNRITINIDAKRPYVEITSPANEEKVSTPFWVKAGNCYDNVGIERVEFDIEPFGEHEGLPYKDYDAPYEWYCDIEKARSKGLFSATNETGMNVMIRAQAFDHSGQTWIHESWIYIKNWDSKNKVNTLNIVSGDSLQVETTDINIADRVKFNLKSRFKEENILDEDINDGFQVSFDIRSGFYKITASYYNQDKKIYSEDLGYYIYIKTPSNIQNTKVTPLKNSFIQRMFQFLL